MADTTIPEHLRYTEDHEWVEIEDDVATVGITDYAQSELGDIVYVEMPEIGTAVTQGKPFGLLEAVKTVADLYAPLSGEVVEYNPLLADNPELINNSTYEEGWIIRIRLRDESEFGNLLDAQAYADQIGA
ncbi:MAG: glycine cleavage system protein GcvH [Candidatus Eiseniibacteriota bacterium]|jgi:glycine cleavage system H protein